MIFQKFGERLRWSHSRQTFKNKQRPKQTKTNKLLILPAQFFPSPVKPDLHEQVYEPLVFVQSALTLQSDDPVMHSSRSVFRKKKSGVSIPLWIHLLLFTYYTLIIRRKLRFDSLKVGGVYWEAWLVFCSLDEQIQKFKTRQCSPVLF